MLAAPGCGTALPFQAADPFLIPGVRSQPIRVVIRVRLAARSAPDSAADSDPAVWRIWHGEGEVLAFGAGVAVRYRVKSKARCLRHREEG